MSIRKTILRLCPPFIHTFYAESKYWVRFHFFRRSLVSEMFRGLMGYDINWENPQDINEKINWMKLYYDTSSWTLLADKYKVREYVKERIGEDVLTELYGVWKSVDEIDFDMLPNQFVFKTNQGAGTVLPVIDKRSINVTETKELLNKWVHLRFGYETVEPHYLGIKPLIFAEQYLNNDCDFSDSIVDYKLFCLSGKVYCILVCTDRILGKHTNLSFYDCDWIPIDDILSGCHSGENIIVPRPKCLSQMIDYAEKLSEGHPQVRVDFYIVDNKIYFGEMTFTSQGGYMDYISREHSLRMGNLINI